MTNPNLCFASAARKPFPSHPPPDRMEEDEEWTRLLEDFNYLLREGEVEWIQALTSLSDLVLEEEEEEDDIDTLGDVEMRLMYQDEEEGLQALSYLSELQVISTYDGVVDMRLMYQDEEEGVKALSCLIDLIRERVDHQELVCLGDVDMQRMYQDGEAEYATAISYLSDLIQDQEQLRGISTRVGDVDMVQWTEQDYEEWIGEFWDLSHWIKDHVNDNTQQDDQDQQQVSSLLVAKRLVRDGWSKVKNSVTKLCWI